MTLEPNETAESVPHIDSPYRPPAALRENAIVLNQLDALRRFARRNKLSEDVVVAVFETERLRLTQGAKVERFVDVLVEKRAKRALRQTKP